LDNSNRKTVIQFKPAIPDSEWKMKNEYVYIFTVDNFIVKIGGTRTSLKERCVSYLCGHHISERGKSGSMSKTNAFIYHTFEHYIRLNHKINMYAYKLPKQQCEITIHGEKMTITPQTYHVYESKYINKYTTQYGSKPQLSDNSDPVFRK